MVWDTSFVPQLCWILIEMGFVGQNLPKIVPLYRDCKLVCTPTLDLVKSIKLILQGESTIKRYTYNTQQLLLKFMALQHGHELEFSVDRHVEIKERQGFNVIKKIQISKWCQFQNEAELLE